MAEFVREVAMASAKSKNIKASEVWGNLRTTPQGGEATSYDTTWLKKDITDLSTSLESGRSKIEIKAKVLIDYISTDTFQQHLVKFHSKALAPQIVQDCYGCSPSDDGDPSTSHFREMDHILAILTSNLFQSPKGLEFLEKITDENWLQKQFAFKDMWGYLKKIKSSSEPIAKVLHNFAPVLTIKINQLIQNGKVATIEDILRDPDLKRHFDFIDKKMGVKISDWLHKKASLYGQGADEAARTLRYRSEWKKSIDNWLNKDHTDFSPSYKLQEDRSKYGQKLDGLWMGLMLDSVALAISVIQLYSNLKKAKWTEFADAVDSLLSLTKTIAGGLESKAGVLIVAEKDAFHKQAMLYKNVGRYLGLIGGCVTFVLCMMKAYDGFKSKDWDVVLINIAGAGLGIVGGVAAFCGASTLGGVTIVLGLLLAVVTTLVHDAPIIDYIEDVAWGEDAVIPIKDTITKYYSKLFKLEASFVVTDYDTNYSFIRIESEILSNTTPVFVEILDSGKKSIGKYTVYPGLKKVNGMGTVEKELGGWEYSWPTHGKRIKILNAWEIWKDLKDHSSKYTICVGIDPSSDANTPIDKMALKDDTVATFPESQAPIMTNEPPAGYTTFDPLLNVRHVSGSWKRYIKNSNNLIKKFVYTKYASGSSIKITAAKEGYVYNTELSTTTVAVSTAAPDSLGLTKTPVSISLPKPATNEDYRITLLTELLDARGVKKGENSTYLDII